MIKKIFDYIVAALCGALSLFIKSKLSPTDTSPGAFVLPVMGAVVLFAVFTLLVNTPKRLGWTRRWFLLTDEAIIEGYWIENEIIKDGIRYYSLFHIRYDHKSEKYTIAGTAHRDDGVIHADWDSVMVKFDRSKTQLSYVYHANERGTKHKDPIHGYAWLKFITAQPVEKGHGYFVDCIDSPLRMEMEIDRIPSDLIKSLIGKREMRTGQRSEFIRKYHEHRTKVLGKP